MASVADDLNRLRSVVEEVLAEGPRGGGGLSGCKFEATPDALVFGRSTDSVMPIAHFMHADERQVGLAILQDDGGVGAIEAEFAAHGTPDDLECLKYVLYGATGDSTRKWDNGVLDASRPAGLTFDHFAALPEAVKARLGRGHVLALRLYTTVCFMSINEPLRNASLSADNPHPLPVTVHLLTEAIKRLRKIEGEQKSAAERIVLWRGMRNRSVPDDFLAAGGSEQAPMSTTRDLAVAVRYSTSECSVLFKLDTESFRERGADLSWVSAFPAERECCFPPLTHLRPVAMPQVVQVCEGVSVTVLEVKPSFG